jgi:hypothetical protein
VQDPNVTLELCVRPKSRMDAVVLCGPEAQPQGTRVPIPAKQASFVPVGRSGGNTGAARR